MSRAFVNEDAGGEPSPRHRYPLPLRDDPAYDAAAALALLKGADVGDKLGPVVRVEQVATKGLRRVGTSRIEI